MHCRRSSSGIPARATPISFSHHAVQSELQSSEFRVAEEVQNTMNIGKDLGFQLDGFEDAIRDNIKCNQEKQRIIQ